MMPRARGDGRVLLQDLAGTLEGAERGRPDRVRDRVVGTGPPALGPHEIIFVVLEQHECAFDVPRRCDLLERGPVGKRHEAREVRVELRDVAMPPAAVNDVVRTITILEYVLIDRLRAIVELVDQRFAEVVSEWSVGAACAGDADASHRRITLNVVRAEEEVVPSVFFHDRRRPERAAGPRYVFHVEHSL